MSTQTWSEGEQQKEDPARSAVDIAEHVAALFRPESAPLLTLGVFERVGSNWVSDVLRPYLPQHNEPFRQQLGARHPLSPNNARPPGPADTDLPGLPAHHLACALADLYGTDRRHMVKETNLWLATGAVTNLLPNSPLLVLSRAPLGIASSFARGNLFERWHYASRYTMLSNAAHRSPHWAAWSALLPEDGPEPTVALARLIAFNTLLLAQALKKDIRGISRPYAHLAYERHVLAPEAVRAALSSYLDVPLPFPAAQVGRATAGAPSADTTFNTGQHKSELIAELDARTATLVTHFVAETLARATNVVERQVVETARHWLSGDDLYEVRDPAPSVPRPRVGTAQGEERRPGPATYRPAVEGSTVVWRTHLVSNEEVAELLNILAEAGMDNTRDGVNLFVIPMRVQRGGRLHQDQAGGRWRPSPGYEHHPAYWVTWLGAAALAAWHGARLPSRAEVVEAAALVPSVYNAGYRFGDATPVIEPGRDPGDIHHLVGNVQVWCQDGESGGLEFPLRRYIVGAAWNTPSTRAAVSEVRSRYLLGASRGVGVRLVRDPSIRAADEIGAWELAERVGSWVNSLDPTGVPVGYLDQALVTTLTGSCAESGEAEAGQD
ncbi:SUMF1/EgtB/PvdO family nonheme iron enzyme [Kitasatospora misakiensis]|uniref:SUMF1/EgtB/PvdO family nonheme iron enzyme n=1 Tax=Kitasatospora misakiensis TaxID=67330 RepID=A0ABW0XFU8_9ACTN